MSCSIQRKSVRRLLGEQQLCAEVVCISAVFYISCSRFVIFSFSQVQTPFVLRAMSAVWISSGVKCLESRIQATPFTRMTSLSHPLDFADTCDSAPLLRVILNFLLTFCLVMYLSSSISRLDSLSDSCLHSASLRSISLWSFLCSRMFSSLMCRSSSMYWARFSVSGKGNTQNRLHQLRCCQAYILATVYHQDQQIQQCVAHQNCCHC